MAIGFDVASESHTGTTGATGAANFSWSHLGGGSARGALVFVFGVVTNALPPVTSVTYGGVTMTALAYNAKDSDTEPGSVIAYYLDNCGTGTKTVQVNRSDATPWAHIMYAVCFTVTGTSTQAYEPGMMTDGGSTSNTGASSQGSGTGTVALKSVDDNSPGGGASLRFMGRYQGTSNVTAAGSGSTAGPSIDFGLYVIDTFRETTAGVGARNVGGATITDDVAAIAVAIRERVTAAPAPTAATLTLSYGTPTVAVPFVAAPTASGNLTMTMGTPVVAVTNNVTVLPTAAALTLTGAAPTVAAPFLSQPTGAALTLTGAAPAVLTPIVMLPSASALTLTGQPPTVAVPFVSQPTPSALSLTGAAPAVSVPFISLPTAAALALTGAVPDVVIGTGAGGSADVQPGAALLTMTMGTPFVETVAKHGGRAVRKRAEDFEDYTVADYNRDIETLLNLVL